MANLDIYKKYSEVPQNATKTIKGGRMSGFTDINPMWRIKSLTEEFGSVGFGWYYEVTRQWLEPGANGEVSAFCNIDLYVNACGEWSKPISGTGGSAFIAKESSGLRTSDEAFKMALTDAISVACKSLGFGANVYWADGRTKYDAQAEIAEREAQEKPKAEPAPVYEQQEIVIPEKLTDNEIMTLEAIATKKHVPLSSICIRYHVRELSELSSIQYIQCLKALDVSSGEVRA